MARKRRKNLKTRQQQQENRKKNQALRADNQSVSELEATTQSGSDLTEEAVATPAITPPIEKTKPLYERLEKLLGAVNTASNAARSSWIGFLGIQAYIFITIAGVSHTSLLLNSNVKLPVVNTQLPLSSFFLFGPLVFLFAHFGFLLPHAMLARKADTLNRELERTEADMPREDYHPYRNEIVSYFFSQALVGPPPSLLYGVVLHLMGWLSFVFFPLFLLLFFQIKFLPFHDAMTSWFHRIYILVDMLVLFVAYKISLNYVAADKYENYLSLSKISTRLFRYVKLLLTPRQEKKHYTLDDNINRVRQYYKNARWGKAVQKTAFYVPRLVLNTIGSINLFFSAMAFLFFSICIATFPGECLPWWSTQKNGLQSCRFSHESWLAGLWGVTIPPKNHQDFDSFDKASLLYRQNRTVFVPTSWFFEKQHQSWFSLDRNLNLVNKDFISNKKFPIGKITEEPSISLRGRNFRHAILDGSDLHFVDFSGADLSYASLEYTDLRGARLIRTSLHNTSLEGAKLQSATLEKAILQGAYLGQTQLENSNLEKAFLPAVYLGRANLMGANLQGASLQGTYLGSARLQGADLSEANLQGANLSNTRLQGAKLDYSNLQATNLHKARLQGASLRFAKLQGANFSGTFLQGADLGQTTLQYSQNLADSIFTFTSLHGASLWGMPALDQKQVRTLTQNAQLSGIKLAKDSHSYKNDIQTLKEIILQDPSLEQRLQATIEKLDSIMLFNHNNKWEGSKDELFWKTFVANKQKQEIAAHYATIHSLFLGKLACADKTKDQWIARNLIARVQDTNNSLAINHACFLKVITAPKCNSGQKILKRWPILIEKLSEKLTENLLDAESDKPKKEKGC